MSLKKFKYKTCTNYNILFELVKTQRVVCFVKQYNVFDVCANTPSNCNDIDIGARGISYIYADNKEDFIKQCEKCKLEFIMPI